MQSRPREGRNGQRRRDLEMQPRPRVVRTGGQTQQATGSGSFSLPSVAATADQTLQDTGSGTAEIVKFIKSHLLTIWTILVKFLKSYFLTIWTILVCSFDVGSDLWNGIKFIQGTDYTKTVSNITQMPENCTLIEACTTDNGLTYSYSISCFEQDPMWGLVTIALMFFPAGIVFPAAGDMAELVCGPGHTVGQSNCMFFIKYFLLFPFYPLLLLSTFICSLRYDTPRMKRWLLAATQSEGTFEASLQLSVQLYIIFSRGDRKPSYIQIFSLVVTILSASKASIETYLHNVNNTLRKVNHQTTEETLIEDKPLVEKLTVIATYLPLFLLTTWFRVGTITAVFVLFSYWAFVSYGCLVAVIQVFCFIGDCPCVREAYPPLKTMRDKMSFVLTFMSNIIVMSRHIGFTREENKPFLRFNFLLYLILNTITIFILIILVESGWRPEKIMLEAGWSPDDMMFIDWGQLAFIQDRVMFYSVTVTVLACGLLSCPLFYVQIYKKKEAPVSENPTVGNESQI